MKLRWLTLVVLTTLIVFEGCKDDEADLPPVTKDPVLELSAGTIHTVQGRVMRLEGNVSDEVGIRSVNLKNDNWFLDKTISFSTDSLIKDYELWYDFKVPESAAPADDEVVITVTNVGDRKASKTVVVKMDGDFVVPALSVTSPVDGLTVPPVVPNPLKLAAVMSDTRRLGHLVVKETSLEFYDSISFAAGAVKNYQYEKTINLPANPREYLFLFLVADSAGNKTEKKIVVKVSADFDKMYLSDVVKESDLTTDLFGVPMVIDKIAPFTFQAKYYAAKPNTEVKFIPQKTSFAPHCYGVDPGNPQKLINSPSTALPIVLPSKGYYKIDINLESMEYKVASYQPTDKPYRDYIKITPDNMNTYVGPLCLVGCGWTDFKNTTGWGWDGTSANKVMTEDPENPYLYRRTEELQGKFELIFDGYHPQGWWPEPFWRFDNKANPEKTVMKGGDNLSLTVPVKARYEIVFDTHLNRAKAVKVE
ncbi:MAG: hypothetical protein ABFD10_03190 [Prolixibacteraceae bacterium]